MKEITNVSYMRRKKVRKQNKISIHVATRPLWDLRKIESDLSLVWLLSVACMDKQKLILGHDIFVRLIVGFCKFSAKSLMLNGNIDIELH